MTVRELRVTDIRCPSCDAGPGESCKTSSVHGLRVGAYLRLNAEGWLWQEVDPTDKGAERDHRGRG